MRPYWILRTEQAWGNWRKAGFHYHFPDEEREAPGRGKGARTRIRPPPGLPRGTAEPSQTTWPRCPFTPSPTPPRPARSGRTRPPRRPARVPALLGTGSAPTSSRGEVEAPGPTGAAPCPRPTPRQRGESPHDLRLPRLPPGAPQHRWLKARGAGSPGGRRRLQPLAQGLKGPKLHVAFERQAAARQGRSRDQQHQPPLELDVYLGISLSPPQTEGMTWGWDPASLCLRRPSR